MYPAWQRSVFLPGLVPGGTLTLMLQVTSSSWYSRKGMSGNDGSFFLVGSTDGDQSPSTFRPSGSKKSNSVYFGPLSTGSLEYL